LKEAIATSPVMVGINASNLMYYTSGIFADWGCSTSINTQMLAIGYGTEGNDLYWIVQAHWGSSFGEKGFVKLSRKEEDGVGICGITEYAGYPKD